MKYIIVDPDTQNGIELKKILDSNVILEFQGSYATFSEAANHSLHHPPDIAFIFWGKTGLNAFRLAREIKEKSPLTKIIFISSQKENAVEAFEYEADGFLLTPLNKSKVGQLLQQNIGKKI